MKAVDQCPVCGNKTKQYPAIMDSWVLNRMLSGHTNSIPQCQLNHCPVCNYAGVNYRFTSEEETVYYRDYMRPGSDYVAQRAIGYIAEYYDSQEHKKIRRNMAATVLNKHIDFDQIASMVDFGGNTGDMIPIELDHAQRYVVEVETRILPNGVKMITSPSESGLVDLVMCSHTLEHVSDIPSIMTAIKSYMRAGSWLYIEVPLEDSRYFGANYNFHEHINLMTKTSLEMLMKQSGFSYAPAETLEYTGMMPRSIAVIGQLLA